MQTVSLLLALLIACAVCYDAHLFHGSSWSSEAPLFKEEHKDDGWLGADATTEVDMGHGDLLILYGDSLIGSMTNSVDRNVKHFIHNTVEYIKADGTRSFHWQTDKTGAPTAFIPCLQEYDGCYLWPTSGFSCGEQMVFTSQVITANASAPMGFTLEGTSVTVFNTKGALPSEWTLMKQYMIPGSGENLNWAMGSAYDITAAAKATPGLYAATRCPNSRSDDIYLLGFSNEAGARFGVMARAPFLSVAHGMASAASLEYLTNAGWTSKGPANLKHLFQSTTAEASMTAVVKAGGDVTWVIPTLETFSDPTKIKAMTAPALTGPWSAAEPIWTIPAPLDDTKKFFCYNPKAHPGLSKAGEVVFTYNCNAHDFQDLGKLPVYLPQVISTKY